MIPLVEVEKRVLGGMEAWPEAVGPLMHMGLEPEHFSIPEHVDICRAIVSLQKAGNSVSLLPIADRLEDLGQLDAVGGMAYLAELFVLAPTMVGLYVLAALVARHGGLPRSRGDS